MVNVAHKEYYISCSFRIFFFYRVTFHESSMAKKEGSEEQFIDELSKYCLIHTQKEITKFCCQHDTILCDLCSTSHMRCDSVVTLETASHQVRNGFALEDLKSRLTGLLGHLKCVLEFRKLSKKNLKKQKKNISEEIANTRKLINAHLDDVETCIHDSLNKQYKICKHLNEKNASETQMKYDTVEFYQESILLSEKNHTDSELFKVIKILDSKLCPLESDVREYYNFSNLEFQINENLKRLKELVVSFGNVSVIECTKKIQELPKLYQGITLIPNEDRKPVLRHSFHTSVLKSDIEVRCGCFLSNNQILLVAFGKPFLFLTSLDGSETRTLQLESEPRDVDLLDNQSAIVTLGDKGYLILDLNTLTYSQCKPPNGKGFYNVSCNNGRIIMIDGDNNVVSIDLHGNINHRYRTMYHPLYILQCDDGSVLYTKVFDKDDVIYKVTREGERQDSMFYCSYYLKEPTGITCDKQGNIYVAGFSSHNVHRVSQDGKRKIILSDEDELNNPRNICFNRKTRQLLVVNNNRKTINIYEL